METIENTKERIALRMEANVNLANAIRRSVSEVPILAIDEVEIYKNDSALYDEVVAHRLGLVPFKTDKKMSGKTKIELKLSRKGAGTVYAEDLKGPAEVVFPRIPITLLGENHKIELVATATLGKGIEHAKYLPGLCYYRHVLKVKSTPQIDKIIENSTGGLVKAEKKGLSWICDLRDADVKEIEEKDSNAIEDSDELLLV